MLGRDHAFAVDEAVIWNIEESALLGAKKDLLSRGVEVVDVSIQKSVVETAEELLIVRTDVSIPVSNTRREEAGEVQ